MRKYTLLLAVLLLSSCAVTPQHTPGSESYYFDCDTPPGKFSEWNRSIIATSIRVTGSIEVRTIREDPHWQPAASVWFIGQNGSRIGLQAFVTRESPDRLQIQLRELADRAAPMIFASTNWTDGPVPFTLSLGDSGVLSTTIAGKDQSLSLGKSAVTKFGLSCSTGVFHFNDITVMTGQ